MRYGLKPNYQIWGAGILSAATTIAWIVTVFSLRDDLKVMGVPVERALTGAALMAALFVIWGYHRKSGALTRLLGNRKSRRSLLQELKRFRERADRIPRVLSNEQERDAHGGMVTLPSYTVRRNEDVRQWAQGVRAALVGSEWEGEFDHGEEAKDPAAFWSEIICVGELDLVAAYLRNKTKILDDLIKHVGASISEIVAAGS